MPNSPRRVLLASLAGTTIEFFDFYIYATAAVLVFPSLFFPKGDVLASKVASLATFALAFFARPIGSVLFGHYGDRVGRKATLVAALLTMGISTLVVGLLPTHAQIGVLAPVLLALCRVGQGIGLGGEWGGAVLLATENAPPGKRAWYGMFPQLGAPLGFFISGATFLALSTLLTDNQFLGFGWRLPFLASCLLVGVGLYVRLQVTETPEFMAALAAREPVAVPVVEVLRDHFRTLVVGTLSALGNFVLFYLLTVFCLSWGTERMGFTRGHFLVMQLCGIVFFAITIPLSAIWAERLGRRHVLISVTAAIVVYAAAFSPLFRAGSAGVMTLLIVGFSLMGFTYGPLGTFLSELFPIRVRYTGSSLTFNLAGILGASLAPLIATKLAVQHGLSWVGGYLAIAGLITIVAVLMARPAPSEPVASGA